MRRCVGRLRSGLLALGAVQFAVPKIRTDLKLLHALSPPVKRLPRKQKVKGDSRWFGVLYRTHVHERKVFDLRRSFAVRCDAPKEQSLDQFLKSNKASCEPDLLGTNSVFSIHGVLKCFAGVGD